MGRRIERLIRLRRRLSVLEFTDPACPWAWGSEPTFRRLRTALGDQADWRRVFGILFDPAEDDPAPDPDAETRWYQGFVDDVCGHTGAPAARRLEWVCLNSWPASQAATAALAQGPELADRVLRRLREQVFVRGRPADTEAAVRAALTGLPGLDLDRLMREAASAEVQARVRADHALTRRPDPEVLTLRSVLARRRFGTGDEAGTGEAAGAGPKAGAGSGTQAGAGGLGADGPHPGAAKEVSGGYRYALPTLVLEGPAGRAVVPGWRPLAAYVEAVRRVAPQARLASQQPSAEVALARWRSLTGPELGLLTADNAPPATALEINLRHGSLWVHPEERNLDRIYQQLTDSDRGDTVVP